MKTKVFELGPLRVLLDPKILARRILTRQVLWLATVAVLGGVVTATLYVRATRHYRAHAKVVIRQEQFDEPYLEKLLAVAGNFVGSETQMRSTVNELDLYPKLRAKAAPEQVTQALRDRLSIQLDPAMMVVSYRSPNPAEAFSVVRYTTERLLDRMQALSQSDIRVELQSVERLILAVGKKKRVAEKEMFEFREAHPEIAEQLSLQIDPASAIAQQIKAAERALATASVERARPPTGEERVLARLEKQLSEAKKIWADAHPKVVALEQKVAAARGAVNKTSASTASNDARAAARRRLEELHARQIAAEKKKIATPKLRRRWSELSSKARVLQSEYAGLLTSKNELLRDQVLRANQFEENFKLVEPARLPSLPFSPDMKTFAGVGAVLTALFGLLIAAVREATRQTFVSATELKEQTGLRVVASLPSLDTR